MERINPQTEDLTQKNIEKIATLFPEVLTEKEDENGNITKAIDFDLLKQHLSKDLIEGSDERYRLDWPGKKRSILKANTPITSTLKPDKDSSENFATTENLYIEGDNFEVLKILQESYLGKIKMIYIDPPYNTGKDFVYKDSFKVSKEDYEDELGVKDEEGGKLVKNTDTNGRFHSDWLSMMYERLLVARDLLTDDGVIFMSIDDNEVDNLVKLSKEICGIDNVEVLIWNKEAEGSSGTLKQTSSTRRIHEYIICAFKDYSMVKFTKVREALKGKENEFQTANLAVNSANEKKDHENYFSIKNPKGKEFKRQWKWSKSHIKKLIENDLIYWGSDGNKQPRLIIPTDDRRTTYLLSILNYGGTTTGRKDFEKIMGSEIEFSYPKPLILLRKLIETATTKYNKDIILDFFAGSSSTAHAVLKSNLKFGGNRKFIMVQLPEETGKDSQAFKKGYKTITEIGKERIRRAGKKILEENAEKLKERETPLDVGFRVYKTSPSILKEVTKHPNQVTQVNLFESQDNIKEDAQPEDILTAVLLDFDITLDQSIETLTIASSQVFKVADNALVACFDKNIDMKVIDAMAKMQPIRAVFRDACFKDDKDLINTVESRFKQLSPDTKVHVI